MRHALARRIIPVLLTGSGFDSRAVNLVNCTRLAEVPGVSSELLDHIIEKAGQLGSSSIVAQVDLPSDPLPEHREDFIRWATAQLSNHPVQISSQLAATGAVAELWSHAQRDERMKLRRLWYWSLHGRKAPRDSYVTREQLASWQRDLPTMHTSDNPSPNALAGMLLESKPESAYQCLASYLGPDLHLPTLTWMLGAMAGHSLLHRFDHRNISQMGLFATVALEQMSDGGDMETLVCVLSQLAHEIWWGFSSDKRRLFAGSPETDLSLEEAIKRGDYKAAQRAARQLSGTPDRFWRHIVGVMQDFVDSNNDYWPRVVAGLIITHARAGNNAISPDDAAVLGGTLAGVSWLSGSQQPA